MKGYVFLSVTAPYYCYYYCVYIWYYEINNHSLNETAIIQSILLTVLFFFLSFISIKYQLATQQVNDVIIKNISKNWDEEAPGLNESAMKGLKARKHTLNRLRSTRNVGARWGGDSEYAAYKVEEKFAERPNIVKPRIREYVNDEI